MLNIRIQQNVRIDLETVEKLIDIKARTGKSITEMYNEALGVYVDFKEKSSGDNPETVSEKSSGDAPEIVPVEETKKEETKKEGTRTLSERISFALGDDMDE
jgi:hypothetical protein